eukprot:SM000063S20077  [mRNA]  locus=s63:660427:661101:- [translate_table: standard]
MTPRTERLEAHIGVRRAMVSRWLQGAFLAVNAMAPMEKHPAALDLARFGRPRQSASARRQPGGDLLVPYTLYLSAAGSTSHAHRM